LLELKEKVGTVGEIKQINFDMLLTLSLLYVIMIYAFIVWLLMKWNNEESN